MASLTSALISGVNGLRWGTTSPIEWVTSGSTMGIERTVSVRPRTSASLAGMTLAQRPVRTWANSTTMESDSSVGATSAPAPRNSCSMMRRFCMSGVSKQSGTRPTSAQVTESRLPSGLSEEASSRYSSLYSGTVCTRPSGSLSR